MKNWTQIFSGIEHAQRKIDTLRKYAIAELLEEHAQCSQNFNYAEPAYIDKAIIELGIAEQQIIRVMGGIEGQGEVIS